MAAGSGFVWEDPFLLDDQLTSDEKLIRDTASLSRSKGCNRTSSKPMRRKERTEHLPRDGRAGLLGATLPEEYGGAEPVTWLWLVAREIERVDFGYRSMMSVQSSLVMYPIYAYGSEEQREKYLPKLATRRMGRLLRPDRARCRLRSRRHAHARREDRRRLPADRHQDVDHQRADRRRVRRLGEVDGARRQHPRLHPRTRHEGPVGAEDRRQAVACAPRSPARSSWTDVEVPRGRAAAERRRASRARSAASIARATASPGARSARRNSAGTPRASTRSTASSSAGRSPPTQLVQKKLADMQTEIALGLQAVLRVGRLIDEGAPRRR